MLVAVGPWLLGNPPAPNATLPATKLLYYSTFPDITGRMAGYHHADEWSGGAWLTTANRTAVVFVGTKAVGEHCWYGWQECPGGAIPCVEGADVGGPGCFLVDGSECNLSSEYYCNCDAMGCDPDCVGGRGWWTEKWEAQILFYDPADLAAVASGQNPPSVPQPYAHLAIDDRLLLDVPLSALADFGTGDQRRYRIGAVAYDRARNLLYVTDQLGDVQNEAPLVHVWQVQP